MVFGTKISYKDPIDGLEWENREEYIKANEIPEISQYPVDSEGYPLSMGYISASESLFSHSTHESISLFLENPDDPTLCAAYVKEPDQYGGYIIELYQENDEDTPPSELVNKLLSLGIRQILWYDNEPKLVPYDLTQKQASILSPVQDQLAEVVWDGDILREDVKDFCFEKVEELLSAFMDEDEIPVLLRRVILIGSITGYQYDPDADLDVNVLIDLDTLSDSLGLEKELLIYEMRHKVGEINGDTFPGTEHPVNLFLSTEEGYPPADGIYDMVTGQWIKRPGHPGNIDPYANLKESIDRAEEVAAKIDSKWGAANRTYEQMQRYPNSGLQIKRQLIRYLKSLVRILENVVNERREVFELAREQGIDPPQTATPNIVYKYLEINGLLETLHNAHHILKAFEESGELSFGMEILSKGSRLSSNGQRYQNRGRLPEQNSEGLESKIGSVMDYITNSPLPGMPNKFFIIDGQPYFWEALPHLIHPSVADKMQDENILSEDVSEWIAGAINLGADTMEVQGGSLTPGESWAYDMLTGDPVAVPEWIEQYIKVSSFQIGDRVATEDYTGTVTQIDEDDPEYPYFVEWDDGEQEWEAEENLEITDKTMSIEEEKEEEILVQYVDDVSKDWKFVITQNREVFFWDYSENSNIHHDDIIYKHFNAQWDYFSNLGYYKAILGNVHYAEVTLDQVSKLSADAPYIEFYESLPEDQEERDFTIDNVLDLMSRVNINQVVDATEGRVYNKNGYGEWV